MDKIFIRSSLIYQPLLATKEENKIKIHTVSLKKKGLMTDSSWPETPKGSERWCGGLAFLYIWRDTLNSELFDGCWDIHWVTYSVALVLAVFSAEKENRQLEDFSLANFGRLPERLPLSVRTKSINENFVNWKWRPLLFVLSWFNAFLHLSANALYNCYSGVVDSFIFIVSWIRLFFSVKGYCVYMINKIIHGCF